MIEHRADRVPPGLGQLALAIIFVALLACTRVGAASDAPLNTGDAADQRLPTATPVLVPTLVPPTAGPSPGAVQIRPCPRLDGELYLLFQNPTSYAGRDRLVDHEGRARAVIQLRAEE